jgi:hypothetical protein
MAAIEAVAEEIAENLEEAAAVTRTINGKSVGLILGGALVGVAVGFYFGHKWNREKIKAEAYKQSEAEINEMREFYQQKTLVIPQKPSVEDVIEEKGYSPATEERSLKPPVPITIFSPPNLRESVEIKDEDEIVWDYPKELSARTVDEPYVIHLEEFQGNESGYSQVTYTYYNKDDVLVGEDERPLPHADLVVGQDNLKWGHGSGNIDVVFVRNDKLQLEMEIDRVPTSYEEEVLGLSNDESD